MSNRRKKRPSNLREALAAKKVREAHYDIPLVSSEDADEAGKRVVDARNLLRATRLTAERYADDDDVKAALAQAEKDLAAAERAYDACFYRVRFRGLSEPDRNALMNAHTPDVPEDAADEEKERLEKAADEAYIYALMEACAVDSDMTADDWKAELTSERWTAPDAATIKQAVLHANAAEFSAAIPKD